MLGLHAWLLSQALVLTMGRPNDQAPNPVGPGRGVATESATLRPAPGPVIAVRLSPGPSAARPDEPADGPAMPPTGLTAPVAFTAPTPRTARPARLDPPMPPGTPHRMPHRMPIAAQTASPDDAPVAPPPADRANERITALNAPPDLSSAPPSATPLAEVNEPARPESPDTLLARAPSGAGAARGATAAAPDVPPPPRPPPPALLTYTLARGLLHGSGRLEWRVEGGCYRLRLESRLPVLGNLLTQTSEGCFDAHGLAPLRHTDRRLQRSERAVNFVRPTDGSAPAITFSASTARAPLRPGAQDRLSWMVQLAARLAGRGVLPPGSRVEMDVASSGGEVQPWAFVLQAVEADGSWRWRRSFEGAAPNEPQAHDTLAEVWTDPARHHWPRRVRLTEGGSDPLELTLQSVQPLPN